MPETPEELYERVKGSLRMPPVEERDTPVPEEIWRTNVDAVVAALEE